MVDEISPSKLYDFTNVIMWKLLTFLVIVSNTPFRFQGNRTLSDSLLLRSLSNLPDSTDSTIAKKIIKLYLNYGFAFVRVKIQHVGNSRLILIHEGPIVKISGIVITPEKYRNLIAALPRVRGKTFSQGLINKIKNRIRTIDYVKLKNIEFTQKNGKIFLRINLTQIYTPNSINSALSVSPRGFSGFLNIALKNLYGRPVRIFTRYHVFKDIRKIKLSAGFPYLFRSSFGLYGDYENEIEDSISYLLLSVGINYRTGIFEVSSGIEKNITSNREEFTLGNLYLKYEIKNLLHSSLRLRYKGNKYRESLRIRITPCRLLDFKLAQFKITSGLDFLRPDFSNGLEYLRGYEPNSINMWNGWTVGIDLFPVKWGFLFVDYGEIQGNKYLSAGIGVTSRRGTVIYGLHPGIPFYDGILTISLKIAL